MSSVMDLVAKEERRAYVRFETRCEDDPAASMVAGRHAPRDVDYVLITPTGTKDVIIKTVDSWLSGLKQQEQAGRVPASWLPAYREQYRMWKENQEAPLDGQPIKGWNVISPAMQETLFRLNVRTIEDAALMNDDTIRAFGIGGVDIKNKAKAALQAAQDTGPLILQNAELTRKLELAEQNLKTLADKFEVLASQVQREQPIVRAAPEPEAPVPESPISADDLMEPNLDEMSDEELGAAYSIKFGTAPHHRMKRETILAKLQE